MDRRRGGRGFSRGRSDQGYGGRGAKPPQSYQPMGKPPQQQMSFNNYLGGLGVQM